MSKRVKVYFDGEGLGDTIGWMGQVERYQKLQETKFTSSVSLTTYLLPTILR